MKPIESLVDYFRSSKAELKKVTWPSRQETIRYSALVMGVSIAIAIFFAGLDFGLGKVIDAAVTSRQSIPTDQQAPTPSPSPTDNVTPTTQSSVPGLDLQAVSSTLVPTKPSTTPTPVK